MISDDVLNQKAVNSERSLIGYSKYLMATLSGSS